MARYIDADALSEKMFHKAFEEDSSDQKWDSGCWIRYHMFEDAIESIPTDDVRENVHARWKVRSRTDKWEYCECQNCGECYDFDIGERFRYCPNCGAEMEANDVSDN